MAKEMKTNVMRILDREKRPISAIFMNTAMRPWMASA